MLEVTTNDDAFTADLHALYARMRDMRPVLESIGTELETRVSNRFETRTDPLGKFWAPWAPATLATYPDNGNRLLLDRLGDMLHSLTHQADDSSVRVGFGQSYAAFHEWGTEDMPRRGLLFADPEAGTLGHEDEAAVLDILAVWLNGLTE